MTVSTNMLLTINGSVYGVDGVPHFASPAYNPVTDTFRAQVLEGDHLNGEAANRCELTSWPSVRLKGQKVAASFGLTIEPGSPNTSPWVVLAQFHPVGVNGDTGSQQCLSLELAGNDCDRFRIVGRSGATMGQGVYQGLWDSAPYQPGREYQFSFEATFHETKGHVVAWCDGKQVVNFTGPCGYGDMAGSYFKAGIYRGAAKEPMAVQIRGLTQL
jgi:hypothetical protein